MNMYNSVGNLTLLHSSELVAFSIVLLLLIKSQLKNAIIAWIFANILTIISINIRINLNISTGLVLLNAASIAIPYYSVNFSQKLSLTSKITFIFILLVSIFSAIFKYDGIGLILFTGTSAVVLMCAWAAHNNPLWKTLWYHNVLTIGFITCAVTIFWRGMTFESNRNSDGFLIDNASTELASLLVLISSILLQIGFIGVLVGYDFRVRRRKDREYAEALELSRSLVEQQLTLRQVAEERLDMISLLTHEVRQPINTAQAALEALVFEIKDAAQADDETLGAVARAQIVLDDITLSISNAILGVALFDENYAIATFASDVVQIAELALSDCPGEQRHRIHISCSNSVVFSNLDPVLIRLSLRNLFDNALKYSPLGSSVHVEITQDEERLGASIKVSSQINDISGLNDDMFGDRVRGSPASIEGSGHGLYLVHKVATAHSGTITYNITDGQHVTFDLFIPD